MLTHLLRPRRLPLFVMAAFGIPVLAAIPGGSMIVAILGISFLIFVHEWGHYYACRLTGTRTETFSIGFGPRLFGWEKDHEGKRRFTVGKRQLDPNDKAMDFRFALIPLGGYVKMAGELPSEHATSTEPDELPNKSALARTFIVSAGVIMNVITAFVLFGIAYGMGLPATPAVVGSVQPGGGAWEAGLQTGDRITHIGGREMDSFKEAQIEIVHSSAKEATPFRVQRGDETLELQVTPTLNEERGMLVAGFAPVSELLLRFGEGDSAREETIGYDEALRTDNGRVLRGGTEVAEYLTAAIAANKDQVVLVRVNGDRIEIPMAAAPVIPGKEDDKPVLRVGLSEQVFQRVAKLRDENLPFEVGDRLLSFTRDGQQVALDTSGNIQQLRFGGPAETVTVERGDKQVVLNPAGAPHAWLDGIMLERVDSPGAGVAVTPLAPGQIALVPEGLTRYPSSPGMDAGIRPGERVVKVGGSDIKSIRDLVDRLGKLEKPSPLTFELMSAEGAVRTVEVTPVAVQRLDIPTFEQAEYKAPIEVDGVGEALGKAFSRTGREIATVFRTIGALFGGTLDFQKNIAGPVTLISVSNRVAKRELPSLLRFLAYISVMLAVLNILPIPVLDGGHLVFILIEVIKGSPLSARAQIIAQNIGLLLLLALMFFAFRNDIRFLINPPV